MRKKLFTLLLAVAASVGTMFAWDYERVQIGDLYYNLDATNQTAEVTSQNSSYPYWSTAIIPASVTYNEITYSVTSIGAWAFSDCTGLTSVTIPNSVTSIGNGAFYCCTGLTSVTIPNSVTNIGYYAFEYCYGLTSVTIPNSVTSIGTEAFRNCRSLTSLTIPNSVTSIGNFAFFCCTGLTYINVASDNSNYCSVDGVLFNKDKTSLIQYPGAKQGAYTIPNSVTSIGDGAFSGCSGLTSVTIPNSVTSIGNSAFSGCSGLQSIKIPNSVTSIGQYAFADCIGLASVTIPNSVTSIGNGAFYGCRGLTSVTCFATTPPQLDSYVFEEVVDEFIPLYVPAGSIIAYQSADVWKDFTNILPIGAQPADVTTTTVTPSATTILHNGQILILCGDKTYTLTGQEIK